MTPENKKRTCRMRQVFYVVISKFPFDPQIIVKKS